MTDKVRNFLAGRWNKQGTEQPEVESVTEFSDEEIQVLTTLGNLPLSSTINNIIEEGADEAHFWRDRKGRVGLHTKRPDYLLDDAIQDTRAFVRFDQDGKPEIVHMLARRLQRMGNELIELERNEAHLWVGPGEVPDFVMEEIDDVRDRVRQVGTARPQEVREAA